MRRAALRLTSLSASLWWALSGCGRSPEPTAAPPTTTSAAPDATSAAAAPDASAAAAPALDPAAIPAAIARLWPDGCFAIRDASGQLHQSDPSRCALPRRPYSTFKLANALIALNAGLLDGPDAAMTWDRKAFPPQSRWPASWRAPQTLRSGLAVSAVPHFRTLAVQIGAERMRAGLAALDYGDQRTGGGLDRFWLSGDLRISAVQQLDFTGRLARGTLDASARAQEVVREISRLAEAGGAEVHGKTGSGPVEDHGEGSLVWLVGWVQRGDAILPFACWMAPPDADLDAARAARDRRLRDTLDQIGAFPRSGWR
ncbi:MAG: penicillin-binding transpeptidase domain-containing protein [Kofleriaceae bacterium]